MDDSTPSPLDRRTVLVAVGAAVLPVAGCIGDGSDSGGPQQRSYTLTITRPEQTLELEIEPAGEVAGVIRITVGDVVEFTVRNRAGVPVGVHNHATDAEVVIDDGQQRVVSFEATEAMTGRQEIEGWVAETGADGGAEDHGGEATTLAIIEIRPRRS